MTIQYSKRASNTPAFALLAEGWNELVQEGFTIENDGACPVRHDDEVVYALGDAPDDVIGVVAFRVAGSLDVQLAYVEPSSRRRGVFKALLAHLNAIARAAGVASIQMIAPRENDPFQVVLRHMGGPSIAVVYDMTAKS